MKDFANGTCPSVSALLRALVLGLLLASGVGTATAQDVAGAGTGGTISGTLAGEEVEWRTVLLDLPDGGIQNTASYNSLFGESGPHSYTLQGHQDSTYIENALAVSFTTLGGRLADCPCTIDAEVMYWTSSSMFEDVYIGNGTLAVDEVEDLEDGRQSLTGTFSATLVFQPSIGEEPVEDDVIEVDVDLEIDRIDYEELDL